VCGATKNRFACKLVEKASLQKMRKRQKMEAELQIHKTLLHPHIVRFHHFFEDDKNVYILLELCANQSLAELIRKRHHLSEFECRYFSLQIISALKYMQKNRVLHRDLKLSNLFLDDKMRVKIGDFGLATRLREEVDLRASICGTPNYMAPEILVA
jgi:polo-like kinase 1